MQTNSEMTMAGTVGRLCQTNMEMTRESAKVATELPTDQTPHVRLIVRPIAITVTIEMLRKICTRLYGDKNAGMEIVKKITRMKIVRMVPIL
jgi:hypothetical protein